METRRVRLTGVDEDPSGDVGRLIVPKVYRRLCTWAVNRRARMAPASFGAYLEEHPDGCYETADFLEQGIAAATHRKASEFVGRDGRLRVGPAALVFEEAGSGLVGARARGPAW